MIYFIKQYNIYNINENDNNNGFLAKKCVNNR